MRPKAEPYHFPKAEELILEEEKPDESPPPPPEEEAGEEAPVVDIRVGEAAEAPEPEPEPEPEPDPVSFAQIQAEQIIADAHRRAWSKISSARRCASAMICSA